MMSPGVSRKKTGHGLREIKNDFQRKKSPEVKNGLSCVSSLSGRKRTGVENGLR